MDYQYEFLDRWVLPATPDEVYEALVDFDLYPKWGYPGYQFGRRDAEPGVGCTGKLVVQGGLPYKVNFDCKIIRLVPLREIAIAVEGDVSGVKIWTIRPMAGDNTELISDWRCNTNWVVFRTLTPVLKPMFRWNHGQCLNTAIAGLSKYLSSNRERKVSARPGHGGVASAGSQTRID
ncbi:MAG: SRPBCC family protein [Deltaproteobacteria bacterium]|nr:SRPBCC family protein [Deltaproteobacteria bacterium]